MASSIWALALALIVLGNPAAAFTPSQQTSPAAARRTAVPPGEERQIAQFRQKVRQSPASASAHLELGIALSNAGLFAEARAEFNRELKLRPDDATAIYNLGLTDLRAAQSLKTGPSPSYYQLLDSAHSLLLRAAHLDPNLPHLHQYLGYLNHQSGDQEGTIEEYTKAVDAEPDSAEAHNDLGSALADVEKYTDALDQYRKAFALNPASASTLMNLEGAVRRTDTAGELLSQSEAALRNSPDSITDRLLHALALYLSGKGSLALPEFDAVLRQDPNLAAAHFFRGEILRENNAAKEAAAEYAQAASLAPDRIDYAARYAAALVTLGNIEGAELVLRRTLARSPDDSSLHFQLGRVLKELHQKDAAEKQFSAASRLKKKDQVEGMVAMDLLDGVKQLRANNPQQAIEKLREAHALAPALPEASFYLAIALSQTGDAAASTQAFEEALQKRPSSAEIHYNFGIALWQDRQAERAIAEFRKAIYLRSDFGLARCALGLALLRSGSPEDGKAEIERSRKLGACQPAGASESQ